VGAKIQPDTDDIDLIKKIGIGIIIISVVMLLGLFISILGLNGVKMAIRFFRGGA